MTFSDLINQGILGVYMGPGNTLSGSAFAFLFFAGYLFCIVSGYLLGSINSAIIVSKLKFGSDIRTSGSGNAGMTNVLRTYGKAPAAMTLGGDAAKTLIAYILGTLVFGIRGAYFACFMCVVGHVFPIFYRFRGGKGIVCAATMILFLDPLTFLILFAVFVIVFFGYKYVSLASIMAAMIYPIAHTWMMIYIPSRAWTTSTLFAVLTATLVLWRHYPNMKRLLDRTESKIDIAKLFGRKKNDEDKK